MGDRGFKLLTFFFPMWNEEETILKTVDAAGREGQRIIDLGQAADYEILLVNDASTDATGEMADALAADDGRIRVVHHPENRKLGGALKTGFAEARGDVVLYTDADLPFDLRDVEKAIRLLRYYDAHIVSAYRFDRTGEGPRRAMYSFLYNQLVRVSLGLRIRDVNFAFKLIRREVLEQIELQSESSFIDVELLAKAERLGFSVVQFGVDYFPRTRGVSTLSSTSVISALLREMRQLVPEIRRIDATCPEAMERD
jgi:glycosyltransferase involved in cell wall biosynthesis